MGRGGKFRDRGRRAVLASTAGLAGATSGCLSSVGRLLGLDGYDEIEIAVQAPRIVWSGTVAFESGDRERVSIPVDRALGSRSYRLPEDIDADRYDTIYPPVTVEVVPKRGVDEDDPLSVVVRCDGERCGSASTTTVDEPARVEID
jgi:hypothetical protein